MSSAQETNDRATAFLERREFDVWGEADEAELNAWLAASKAHCAAFWRLEAAWDRTHRLAALRAEKRMRASPAADARMPRLLRMAAGAGAIALIAAASAAYMLWPRDTVYETPIGGHQTIALADGSQIELNTGTILRAQITDRSRAVTLVHGEAYFRIHHDSTRPFVVTAAGRHVTDLGTAFTVRSDAGGVRVALFEGRAQFDSGNAGLRKPLTLAPGDTVLATATGTTVSHIAPRALADGLGWRRGVVIFRRTTLAEVAAEFNRYNHVKLVIANADAARLTVGGTFPANNVELFGRMASAILGLRVTHGENEIVISR